MTGIAIHSLHAAGVVLMAGVIVLLAMHPGRERLSTTVRWVGAAVAGLAVLAFLFAEGPLARFQMISEYIQAVLPMSWIFLLYACIEEDSRRQLTAERNRLQAVVSDIPVMIVAFDDDMKIALWNHEAERVTGYDMEALADSAELADLIDLLEGSGNDHDRVWRIQRYPDGETRTVAWTRVPGEIQVPGWRTWATGIDMTERETTRAELLESRETLALAIEGSGAAIWTLHSPPARHAASIDDMPDEMYMSPRLKAFIGYDDHEFPSSTSAWRDRIHPDDQPTLDAVATAHLSGESPVHATEYRIRHRDGSWRWISTRGKVRRDASGNVIIWSGMDWDITEQKEATERLLASERRFRTLTETSPSGIWHVTTAGRSVYLNPAMIDMLEIEDPAEVATDTFHRFFTDASVERIRVEQEKRLAGLPSSYEAELIGQRGTHRHVIISAAPLLDEAGELLGTIGTFTDISELKRAQLELIQERDFSRRTLDTLPGLFLQIDQNRRLMRWNDTLQTTLGYTESELLQIDVLDFVPLSQHASVIEAMARVFEHGEHWAEVSVIDKAGNERPYFFSTKLHAGSDTPSLLAIGIDLTDQKAADQERQALQQQLLQSQKLESLGLLAGGISHDFNNLLTTIIGYSNLLLESKDVDPSIIAPLGEIHRAGERASELTGQLLAFSRHQELRPQVVDLREVIRQLEPMLDRLLEETITLDVHAPDQVPPIKADTGQLEQIIINLVVNARDAMPAGGRITVTVEPTNLLPSHLIENDHRPLEGLVRLTVEDNGSGIEESLRQKIFEPFFTTKEVGKGTGLGLSTVYGIVHQFGAWIDVESQPGEGSRFILYFPVSEGTVDIDATVPPDADPILEGDETVLLIEDDTSLREFSARVLERYGYRVVSAATGEEALERFKKHRGRIDILLTDVVLPGDTGYQVARTLQAHDDSLKVLFMSGYTRGKLEEAKVSINLPFIQKPFTPRKLAARMREVLDSPLVIVE